MRKYHSVKENGKRISVAGKVVIVASPDEALDIETEFTRNAMGTGLRNYRLDCGLWNLISKNLEKLPLLLVVVTMRLLQEH